MRCLALAQAWKARVGEVTFISVCASDALCQRIKKEGLRLVRLGCSYPDPADLDVTSRVLGEQSEAWLVLDGYGFDSEYQHEIKKNGHRLLVIDDTASLPRYYADVILNQNINAERLYYNCDASTRLLLGSQYVLLRSEFLVWRGVNREISKIAGRVLITLGGADPTNQTLKVLRALQHTNIEGIEVRIVIGACNAHIETPQSSVAASGKTYKFLRDVKNMARLMNWADIAVSAAGSTSWELAFMGVPFLTAILAQNQERIAKGLGEVGAAINLGWLHDLREEELAQYLVGLVPRWEVRQRLSRMARELVDGLGAERVTAHLSEL